MDFYSDTNKIEIEIYDALKEVIDPELGINIIDMGLVYEIKITEKDKIEIKMTLSTKNCPMGDVISNSIGSVLNERFPNYHHEVTLVWEPAWSSEFISPKGKKELGIK